MVLITGWVGNPITWPDLPPKISKFPKLPDFCQSIEWAIKLPYSICHLKSPNCQNYPIFVTWLSGRSNYPTQFTTWNLQISKSPHLCYPVCVGDLITHPDLPTDTHCLNTQSLLPSLSGRFNYPTLCYTFSGGNIICFPGLPTYHLKSPPTNYWSSILCYCLSNIWIAVFQLFLLYVESWLIQILIFEVKEITYEHLFYLR